MFNLTEKQQIAVQNLENFLNLSGRTFFEKNTDFQEYFEFLLKKSQKKSKILKNISDWKISTEEINKKNLEKKNNFFSKENNLKEYWIKYLWRYFPTKKKFFNQLSKKTSNINTVEKVYSDLEHLIDEEKLINSNINNYISRWKNLRYIKQKLYEKLFEKELILKKVEVLENMWCFLDEDKTRKKIIAYFQKWKSIDYVKKNMITCQTDREFIENIINEIYWFSWESEILIQEYEKLKNKWFSQEKIIKKLLSKWFYYQKIKEIIT